jgi:hypothetical protein
MIFARNEGGMFCSFATTLVAERSVLPARAKYKTALTA